jgi:hypothetical protein
MVLELREFGGKDNIQLEYEQEDGTYVEQNTILTYGREIKRKT